MKISQLVVLIAAILALATGCASQHVYEVPRVAQQVRILSFVQGRLTHYALEAKKQDRLDVRKDVDELNNNLISLQYKFDLGEIEDVDAETVALSATKIELKLGLKLAFPSLATPLFRVNVAKEEANYRAAYERFRSVVGPVVQDIADGKLELGSAPTPERSETIHARAVLAADGGKVCYGFTPNPNPLIGMQFACFPTHSECTASRPRNPSNRTLCFTSEQIENSNVELDPDSSVSDQPPAGKGAVKPDDSPTPAPRINSRHPRP